MDYWYYFLHRGLDLLRENGRLSFIVNSYWTASAGAAKLIQRLEQETTLEEILLLEELEAEQRQEARFFTRGGREVPRGLRLPFGLQFPAAGELEVVKR